MGIFIEELEKVIYENELQEHFDNDFLEDITVYISFLDDIPSEKINEVAIDFLQHILKYKERKKQTKDKLSKIKRLYKRKYKKEYIDYNYKPSDDGLRMINEIKEMAHNLIRQFLPKFAEREDLAKRQEMAEQEQKVSKLSKDFIPSKNGVKVDIKIAKKFRDMLLINAESIELSNRKRVWLVTTKGQKELQALFKLTEKLIDDLEKEKFEMVSKYKYYERYTPPSKKEIRSFIKTLKTTYNLNITPLDIDELLKQI